MNWTHFLLWVAGLYTLYYLALIFIDLAGGGRKPAEQHSAKELTFSESLPPTEVKHEPVAEQPAKNNISAPSAKRTPKPEVIGSGGVGFNELFRLAKQEAIIYTQSVSF